MDEELEGIDLRADLRAARKRSKRRERIACYLMADAAKSVHAKMPTADGPVSARNAAIVALAYSDALIAELDK